MLGETISHYRILEKLGQGGMGEVYLAEDIRLGHKVAVKRLPEGLVGERQHRARFQREARAIAHLSHPNILTLHEYDDIDGDLYFIMEYASGGSLADVIEQNPQGLSVDQVLKWGYEAADALTAAHEQGIHHRDVKPANLLLTEKGDVRVADFGLARTTTDTQITQAGAVLGTLAFMSPEQMAGVEADARGDVFSLGATLCELLTGHRRTRRGFSYANLDSVTELLNSVRTDLPPELTALLEETLQRDPAKRIGSASEVAQRLHALLVDRESAATIVHSPSLRRLTARTGQGVRPRLVVSGALLVAIAVVGTVLAPRLFDDPPPPIANRKSIAVLPFQSSGPPDLASLSRGFTNAIIVRLANLDELTVISRRSSSLYASSDKGLREIGNELGVDYVVEGTVERQHVDDPNSPLRVSPALIAIRDEAHVWAQTFELEMADIFRIQSEIAERVALELDVVLLAPDRARMREEFTKDLDAYRQYLVADQSIDEAISLDDWLRAEQLLVEATSRDPQFGPAWALLSVVRTNLHVYWGIREARASAKAALEEALRVTPESVEARLALASFTYRVTRDLEIALEQYEEVRRLQPSNPDAALGVAYPQRRMGRWEQAAENLAIGLRFDPHNARATLDLGDTYYWMRRFDESVVWLDRAISMNPGVPIPYEIKATAMLGRGDSEPAARQPLLEALANVPDEGWLDSHWGIRRKLVRIFPEVYAEVFSRLPLDMSSPLLIGERCMYRAELALTRGDVDMARAYCDTILASYEAIVCSNPTDLFAHIFCGIAYAGLGRTEDSERSIAIASQMVSTDADAYSGTTRMGILAEISARNGNADAAVRALQDLLARPSRFSPKVVERDPIWKSIEDDPRFQSLIRGRE